MSYECVQMTSFMLSCLKSSGANTLKRLQQELESKWVKSQQFSLRTQPAFTKTFRILPTKKFLYSTQNI